MKNRYEVVAPNIRRTVFEGLEFSNKLKCLSIAFATIQTYKSSRDASDVITYPLIQQAFAFLVSNVEGEIDDRILALAFVRNKSEKDVAKIMSITIMRFPC